MCGKRRFYGIAITVGTVCLLAAIVINLYRNDTGLFQSAASSLSDEATSSFVLLADVSYENTVLNNQDAMQAAEDLGLCKSASDLAVYNTTQMHGETFYQLQQIYEGIDVYGHSVSVLTDENGNITAASGNYVSVSDIDTVPSLSLAEAADIVYADIEKTLGLDAADQLSLSDEADCESVIFLDEYEEPHLTYEMRLLVDGMEYGTALVDADTGILLEMSIISEPDFSSYEFDTHVFGNAVVSLSKNNTDSTYYIFSDEQRNLVLYDALKSKVDYEYDSSTGSVNVFFEDNPNASVLPAKTNDLENVKLSWTYAYAGATLTYDYFMDVLGRDGFDGYGGSTYIICNTVNSFSFLESLQTNASSVLLSNASVLCFECSSNLAGLNIVSHEYSHSVEKSITLKSASETSEEYKAVRESIADIFAEMVEAWITGEDPDWIYSGNNRKLYNSGAIFSDAVYDYNKYGGLNPTRDEHSYSTISSYAMYLIWNSWRSDGMDVETAMTAMSELLYRALFLIPDNASFQDFAYVLYTSGMVMEISGEITHSELQAILDAFNSVNVKVSVYGLKEYEYNDWDSFYYDCLTEAAYAVISVDGTTIQNADAQELAVLFMLPHINEKFPSYTYDDTLGGFRLSSRELSDLFCSIYGDYSLWNESNLDSLTYYKCLDDGSYLVPVSEEDTAVAAGWELNITDYDRLKSIITMSGTLVSPKSEGSALYNIELEFERNVSGDFFFRGSYALVSLTVEREGSALGICSGEIYDAETGAPIQNACVSFYVYDSWLPDELYSEIQNSVFSDEDGFFSFGDDYEPGFYKITCQADGYQDYTGSIKVIANSGKNGVDIYALNEIYMNPSFDTDTIESFDTETETESPATEADVIQFGSEDTGDSFGEQIATLAAQYGVIATGTDSYDSLLENIDNTAETFSSSRISGLLCADIYDYDMDGTDELMVLRVDPGDFSAGDLDYASTNLYVSIYESTESGVVLAAEKQLTLTCGLGWGNTSNVFSLFRYISQTGDDLEDDPPQVNLGFDYYCNLSGADLTFGLIALTYDGANLLLADGLECMEDADENYAAMYVASDEGALTNLTGRMYRNEENGWSTNDRNNGDGFYGFDGDFTDYEACFDQLLRVRFDLWDELAFRSMFGELNVSSVSGLAYVIGLSPAELYDDSSITELCTIQAPWYQGGITLTCEDDGGLLDSYRGNADTNSVETDSDETIIVLSATIDG